MTKRQFLAALGAATAPLPAPAVMPVVEKYRHMMVVHINRCCRVLDGNIERMRTRVETKIIEDVEEECPKHRLQWVERFDRDGRIFATSTPTFFWGYITRTSSREQWFDVQAHVLWPRSTLPRGWSGGS